MVGVPVSIEQINSPKNRLERLRQEELTKIGEDDVQRCARFIPIVGPAIDYSYDRISGTEFVGSLGIDAASTLALGGMQKAVAGSKAALQAQFQRNLLTRNEWLTRKAKIHGKAQVTGTSGHDYQSMREAIKISKQSDIKEVYMDTSLKKITQGKVNTNQRPDVTGVHVNDKLDMVEVKSKSQTVDFLQGKLLKIQNKYMPDELKGIAKVVKPGDK